jgi:2-C-methyl-D-erythritol 2,4-cyclodiphosphate synthase
VSEARVGLGFDVHARAADRPLRLGGVLFAGEEGLIGHSDADVVCHAIADALLGAAVLGDLGERFPDSDPAFAGIGGLDLLDRAVAILEDAGRRPEGCDVTVICERPAITPRRQEMRAALASALKIGVDRVSVKATRPEGLGLSGDGVGAMAIVTVV